jgi:hypothetical protein
VLIINLLINLEIKKKEMRSNETLGKMLAHFPLLILTLDGDRH